VKKLDAQVPLKNIVVIGTTGLWFAKKLRYLCKTRNTARARTMKTNQPEDWKLYRIARNLCNSFMNKS